MTESTEVTPIEKLRALGEKGTRDKWPDYLAYGINESHIPELTSLALQWSEEHADADYDLPEMWAPVHAWRALGQLRAAGATDALLSLLHLVDDRDDDWVGEEVPDVFGRFGAPAIPALAAYLADTSRGLWARTAAMDALEHISDQDPEARPSVIAVVTRQLELFAEQDPILNASLMHPLVSWKVTESAPLIQRAYEADRVDLTFRGDWEDVQVALGLKAERETPRPRYFPLDLLSDASATPVLSSVSGGRGRSVWKSPDSKAKSKRKQAKKSRQKNRRKKK